MEGFKAGMLARSKAGHDKGKVYVIIEEYDTYLNLAYGGIRTLGHLKKKKKKHVQPILKEHDVSAADDTAIKRILKEWSMEESKTCQKLT